jgi:hydroxypyruvate isomerase
MPCFAANLSMMFTELPFLERFAGAAGAGFTGVEYLFPYDYSPDELAERQENAGLEQVLFNLPPGDWDAGERGLAALPGREGAFEAAVKKAMTYAARLRCPRVHVMAGINPPDVDPAAAQAVYVRNLKAAAAEAARFGVTILIEPISPRTMPGYHLARQAQARETLDAVAAENLRVQLDLFHCQIVEGDLATTIREGLDLVGHIQIAGVPDRHEPSTGEINYPYLFALLDELGYGGWIGCEYRPAGRTLDGLGWAHAYGIGRDRAAAPGSG